MGGRWRLDELLLAVVVLLLDCYCFRRGCDDWMYSLLERRGWRSNLSWTMVWVRARLDGSDVVVVALGFVSLAESCYYYHRCCGGRYWCCPCCCCLSSNFALSLLIYLMMKYEVAECHRHRRLQKNVWRERHSSHLRASYLHSTYLFIQQPIEQNSPTSAHPRTFGEY